MGDIVVQESDEKHHDQLYEKRVQMKSQIEAIDARVKEIRENQMKKSEEDIQRMIEKMVKNEEQFKSELAMVLIIV